MKNISTIITLSLGLFLFVSLNAQITSSSQWTWMKGDSSTTTTSVFSPPGIYGVQGIAAATNKPGARYLSISWTDIEGNFWLFGGYGTGASAFNRLNDLWKYSPATNQWTWVKGDSIPDQPAVYGTMRTPAVANKPGARTSGISWTDATGNLWLFGGYGYASGASLGYLNDLWKYSPATNQWTWVKGITTTNQPATYGTMGTSAESNDPGARVSNVSWIDNAGNLWLFGGSVNSTGISKLLNDIWKYNIATNQWTWVKGSGIPNQAAVYGLRGTPAETNDPGARSYSAAWTDGAGNLWLFGGADSTGIRGFHDVWKYSPSINQWAWINGGSTINQPGVYGIMGMPSEANTPGGRFGSATWTDNIGNFWLFGGYSNITNFFTGISFNDLWKYNPSNNQWTWVKGLNISNQPATYGTIGTPSANNTPGARSYSVSWKDATGNFWLFGGIGSGGSGGSGYFKNDLWKLGNSSVLPVTLSSVKAHQQSSGIAVEWKVENENGMKQYDIEKSSDGIMFTKVAMQAATGNNLSTVNYAWLDLNTASGNNFYRIRTISSDGEIKYSPIIKVSIGKGMPAYEVYPNPVTNRTIQLQFINQLKGVYQVRILNTFGQVLQTYRIAHEAGSSTETIKPGNLVVKGTYILEVTSPDKSRQSVKIVY